MEKLGTSQSKDVPLVFIEAGKTTGTGTTAV